MKALKLLLVLLAAASLLSACGIIHLRAPGTPVMRITSEPTSPPPPGLTMPPTSTEVESAITAAPLGTQAPAVLPTSTAKAVKASPTATKKAAAPTKAARPPASATKSILAATKTAKPSRTPAPPTEIPTATATRPTSTPRPPTEIPTATATRPTSTPTSSAARFTITFVDRNKLVAGGVPFVAVLRSDAGPVILPAVVLNELFNGPTEEEQASGLELVTNGFTRVRRLDIAGGVARIYLKGACAPGETNITIADLILQSMEQFRPQIRTIKIYDEYGRTRYPSGALDSAPRCLYP